MILKMVGPNGRWWPDFLLLGAIWGATFLFMRLAVTEFGALPTAALRAGVGALALLPLLFWYGQAGEVAANWPRVFVAGVLNASIPSVGLSYALLSLTTGVASVVNATVPLFGALLAWAWLGQRPRFAAGAGLAGGFAGIAALTWDTLGVKDGAQGSTLLAVLSAAAAAGSGAFSALYARRYLQGVPPVALAAGSQTGAALGLAVPAILSWPHTWPGPLAWLGILGAGVVCTAAGYLVFFRLIEKAGPNRAMTVTFIMPLFAMLYGSVLLGERVTPGMLACAGFIIGCTALSTWPRRRA